MKNDIANQQLHPNVAPCGKYKLCPQTYTAKIITNDKVTITEKIKGTGNCKERVIMFLYIKGLIYWTYRKTTFTALLQTSLRHQKQITQQQPAKYFHESHNLIDDPDVTILQTNIKTAAAQRYHVDKWICKLKTLAPNFNSTLKLVTMLKKGTISTNSVTDISFDFMFR